MHPHTWITGRFLSWREVLVPQLRRPQEGGEEEEVEVIGWRGSGALRPSADCTCTLRKFVWKKAVEATKRPTVLVGKAQEQNSLRAEQKSETVKEEMTELRP